MVLKLRNLFTTTHTPKEEIHDYIRHTKNLHHQCETNKKILDETLMNWVIQTLFSTLPHCCPSPIISHLRGFVPYCSSYSDSPFLPLTTINRDHEELHWQIHWYPSSQHPSNNSSNNAHSKLSHFPPIGNTPILVGASLLTLIKAPPYAKCLVSRSG